MPLAFSSRRRPGRAALIIVTLIAVLAVVGIAWFQEPLSMMLKLQTWDKGAPVKVVRDFLEAGKKGDQAAADRLIGDKALQPLVVKGKWLGYQKAMPVVGMVSFPMKEMQPKEFPSNPKVEYVTMGEGAAEVWVPNAKGKPNKFRLERRVEGWRITEVGAPILPKKASK